MSLTSFIISIHLPVRGQQCLLLLSLSLYTYLFEDNNVSYFFHYLYTPTCSRTTMSLTSFIISIHLPVRGQQCLLLLSLSLYTYLFEDNNVSYFFHYLYTPTCSRTTMSLTSFIISIHLPVRGQQCLLLLSLSLYTYLFEDNNVSYFFHYLYTPTCSRTTMSLTSFIISIHLPVRGQHFFNIRLLRYGETFTEDNIGKWQL